MIIKSHIRGRFRDAAAYLKAQGENEKIRTVEISDIHASNLDEAFENMRGVASHSKAKKPLHHISINPYEDERLTDEQVLKIVERCEEKYGYKKHEHQRVIVEHIKDGRQHFHVMWNRVSLETGKAVDPGLHWNKSKQVAREMEKELGLKTPIPKRRKRRAETRHRINTTRATPIRPFRLMAFNKLPPQQIFRPVAGVLTRRSKQENKPDSEKVPFRRPEWEYMELLAWAWEQGRIDILAQFGIFLPPDAFEP